MGDDKNKTPLIPISGVLVILAALGITIFTQPFKGARPPAPDYRECHTRVNARLWQDPFQAVLDGAKGRESLNPCEFNISSDEQREESQEGCPASIGGTDNKEKLTVLGVMVPGAPYVEDGEKRMRYRYAVLSGLGRLGYVPEDPEHIEFIKVIADEESKSHTLWSVMPLERLVRSRPGQDSSRIVVLWINDTVFAKEPLKRIDRLANYLSPLYELKDRFKIIGPAYSDTLREMAREAWQAVGDEPRADRGTQNYKIYSAMATIDDRTLLNQVAYEGSLKEGRQTMAGRMFAEDAGEKIRRRFRARGFELVRTIGSDWELADKLIDELKLRNVDLADSKTQILIVAEWDRLYGRSSFEEALFAYLAEAKQGSPLSRVRRQAGLADAFGRVRRMSYLRGIDGRLPGEMDDKSDGRKEGKGEAESDMSKHGKRLEQPVGKSQYDYLRRLSEEMDRLNDESRRMGKGEIKAVGVMGTDFYDKYLVLQALRQRFSDAVYFTTDMDARLLHPDNMEWTRNLVVASNFDLSLRKDHVADIQGEIPPFRDSYQTALFFTILKAFSHEICRKSTASCNAVQDRIENFERDKKNKPMIFEVGRRSAILLNHPGDTIHPLTSRPYRVTWQTVSAAIMFLFLVPMFLILTSTSVNKYFKWVVFDPATRFRRISARLGPIVAVAAIALAVYWISGIEDEEPFSILEGISVWPTEILRIAAIILSWAFFHHAWRIRKENTEDIVKEFGFGTKAPEGMTRKAFAQDVKSLLSSKTWSWGNLSKWSSNVLDLGWAPKQLQGQDRNLKELWQEYHDHDKGRYRFWRVAFIAALYMGLCITIISLDPPVSPVRGPASYRVDWVILRICVVSFVLLVSYVFDVTTFCRRFISIASQQFSNRTSGLSEREVEDRVKEGLQLIRLITVRTSVIGKFIFYPFIVWLIILFSRFTYFDNWKAPIGLAVVMSLAAAYTWASALLLRLEAEKARASVMSQLKRFEFTADLSDRISQKVNNALNHIGSIREGAFAPLSQQPVLHVLFVAFGSLGGMFGLDLLSKLNL